jgi:peptidoglycan/xylan/chitin deacetylase (PgdA/CDA1 family)
MALAVICAAFFLLSGNAPASDSSGVADHDVQAILAEMTQDAGPPTTPFAGQSLNEIAAVLARRYANKTPVAWGEHLPGVISTLTLPLDQDSGPVIALTLDACGGRKGASYDAELIAMLRQWEIPATLFVTSLWIRNNPETLAELAADPLFEIAAHGSRHYPCFVTGKTVYDIRGTASFAELVVEVEGNARDIERATGRRPRWFRAGTAYYDDLAVQAIRDMGLNIAGYSIAGDEGATLSTARVKAKVLSAKHGDILLLHMNKPHSGTREGLRQSLPLLLEQGASFVRLSDEK